MIQLACRIANGSDSDFCFETIPAIAVITESAAQASPDRRCHGVTACRDATVNLRTKIPSLRC